MGLIKRKINFKYDFIIYIIDQDILRYLLILINLLNQFNM